MGNTSKRSVRMQKLRRVGEGSGSGQLDGGTGAATPLAGGTGLRRGLAERRTTEAEAISLLSLLRPTVLLLTAWVLTTHATAQVVQPTEAERLARVKELIARQPPLRLHDDGRNPGETALCKALMRDLMKGKGFVPVEPVMEFKTDFPSAEYPDEVHVGPPKLIKDVERCGWMDEGSVTGFRGFDVATGAPPFRVYSLKRYFPRVKGTDLMYWSEYLAETSTGREGYSRIDLKTCEHVPYGPGVSTDSSLQATEPDRQRAALAAYRRTLLVVWDVTDDLWVRAEVFRPATWTRYEGWCRWTTPR
ncbi:MAG: hypothetical protein GTN84_11140 [Hydrogenophaga sp.]|uniref:hypothetical protein n=1 Tax=Hydrogenophaga sp. TaxID=1904254 RepID=UPI0016ADFFC4|nr:hypothetical protein [Hydrogenophaga sp.]NIM41639.1 hypothetical protein [Hydrogenophaga sp.]NIN26944.1 hypothetical protein [Hydrogenophaga sp.]NIN31645.1 hypothetical protein [Hydrogenophaga sp.]NIN55889.1 hypothetical protein [Hydrogenophaga sp.]NIO52016.1 hypothetical protein [Hydrogenophaga sp.]